MSYLGAPVRRREDRPLLIGAGRYVANIRLPGMLHLALLRSPHAHARIRTVDAARALLLSGVTAVITAADLGAPVPRIAVRPVLPDLDGLGHPLLADGVARYVGEPVAAVLARDRYVAEDGVDRVRVEYDVLPAVPDVDEAIAPGAPVLHAGRDSNVAFAHTVCGGDYTVATAAGLPEILCESRESPSPLNPLGAKGIGESGTIGAPPAIVNAVEDALRPDRIAPLQIPLAPDRVWMMLQAARSRGGRSRAPEV